jgi:hypothetical protein
MTTIQMNDLFSELKANKIYNTNAPIFSCCRTYFITIDECHQDIFSCKVLEEGVSGNQVQSDI